ncbi:hypothetical protein [Frigoriglobus tundricola]|uniref:Uncharacterized protein n=1 Tax=Frigoriglobus tundricola TaxID=2774151 RepID=A0A6M5YRP8_9BACT|nr:hypothetical protein [Frigoriglobus tundricola]QJW96668.1 hypothetical protein FTUN_4225 [Frigoriglobus tundricola]
MDSTEVATGLDAEDVALRLARAVTVSERAVLNIGRMLGRIVDLATAGAADRAADDEGRAVADIIASVMTAAGGFTAETRSFLDRQLAFAKTANAACRCIAGCSESVATLMQKSRILALNMQIEASRLKVQNTALTVIGVEMAQFSQDVRRANAQIAEALTRLSDSLPQLESETVAMGQQATTFAARLGEQLNQVQAHEAAVRRTKIEIERGAAEKNKEILGLSQQTLSELQFQDPMAQDLNALIGKMTGTDYGATLGSCLPSPDERTEAVPGEVELF